MATPNAKLSPRIAIRNATTRAGLVLSIRATESMRKCIKDMSKCGAMTRALLSLLYVILMAVGSSFRTLIRRGARIVLSLRA